MAESSDSASTLAARILRREQPTGLTLEQLNLGAPKNGGARYVSEGYAQQLLEDAKALAGSVLAQDETKGLRGLVRKVLGK